MNYANTISNVSKIVAVNEQVSSNLSGSTIILHLGSGTYFGLNGVGAEIWKLVQTPISVQAICTALLNEYDVEPEHLQQDLLTLLQQFADKQLIEVSNATVP